MRLAGVDDIGELDAVLDEENRYVVADQIEIALVRVELDGKTPGVPNGIGGPARPQHGGEPDEYRCLAILLEKRGHGDRAGISIGPENSVCSGAASVHHPLRDALVIEMRDFLAEVEVLEQ